MKKKINKYIETKMGRVHIKSKLTLDHIQDLIFASDFTKNKSYTSIFTRKETLETIAEKGGSITLALLENKTIVGFAVLDEPDEDERWAKLGKKIIMELKAVEVLRKYRHHGIARGMLTHLLSDPGLEEKILYLTAYSWTWDLDHTGLSLLSYRNILMSLYAGFKFIEYPTNDPNICLKPENIFMARVGKTLLQPIREQFKWLRFGIPF